MRARSFVLAPVVAAVLLLWSIPVRANTITVNTAVDEDNGNAVAPVSQGCSLREAMQAIFLNTGAAYKGCAAPTVNGPNTIDITVAGPIVVNSLVPDPGNPMAMKRNGTLPDISAASGAVIIQGTASTAISCDASPNGVKLFNMKSGSDLTLTSLGIKDCTASGGGIAITNTGGDLTINTVTFTNIHSDSGGDGGVINHTGGSLNMNVVNFLMNGTSDVANPMAESGNGGAIAMGSVSLPDMVNLDTVTFTSNSAANNGGAIAWTNSDALGHLVTIKNAIFTSNTAKGSGAEEGGGAIWAQTDTDLTDVFLILNTQFLMNSADNGVGGAIALSGGQLAWVDANLPLAGGVVASNFYMNTAGGAATSDASGGSGGAIYARGNLTVVQSSFKDNSSTHGSGGAILLRNPSSSSLPLGVANTTFNGNLADQAGGAIASVDSSQNGAMDLRNVTFSGNGAAGNTAAGNTIAGGGELYSNNNNANPAFPRIVAANTIFDSSVAGTPCAGAGFVDGGNNLQFPGNSCGASIATANPMLGAATVHLTAANSVPALNPFVLSMAPGPSSPALGAGSNAVCNPGPVLTFDATGVPFRPFGDANCDIGALEGAAKLPNADLSITKTDGVTTATPGASVTYTIVASNAGPDAVMGATVADSFPAACTTVSWTCTPAGGASCAANGSSNINDTVNLPSGGSATYTVQCAISPAATGSLVNTATISSSAVDPNPGNDSATDTDTLVPSANLGITKTDGVSSATPGTPTTYTIVATNPGPSNAPGSTVSDTFPAKCASVSWTCIAAGGATCTAGPVATSINDPVNLPKGGSVTYTATCQIAAAATGSLVNTATVTSGVSDPTPGNNSATDTDTLSGLATTTAVVSSANPSTFGQAVTFTATVSAMSGTPTGTVDFLDGVTPIASNVALVAGQAGTTTSSLAVGGHPITAVYSGDATYDVSTSPVLNQNVQAPTVSIGDVTKAEGNSGTTTFGFPVTLSFAIPVDVVVTYATADSTATVADLDYAAASGLLTISAGQTSKTLNVLVNGDTKFENSESFLVNLSAPQNATILDGQAIGTITNDDTQPTISINDRTLAEGNSGTTPFGFTVSLSNPSFQTVSVNFATADGTATLANLDYVAGSGPVVFAPGQTSQPLSVLVNGDTTAEPDETFLVNLSSPSNASIADSQGVGTITNDDTPPTLSIGDVTLAEGNSGTTAFVFPVTLSAASGVQVTVGFASADGTATTADLDYTAVSGLLTFTAGQTSKTVTVQVNGDTKFESNETFTVNLSSPVGATILDGQGVGTITNDDTQPTLSIGDAAGPEGNNSPGQLTFTVSLSSVSAQQVTAAYATADGTATTADFDYQQTSGLLTFAPGQTSRTLSVTIYADLKQEPDETFAVNLSAPTNATILDGQGVGTLQNDDGVPALRIADVARTEGNSGATGFSFDMTLTNPSAQQITVQYATADGPPSALPTSTASLAVAPGGGFLYATVPGAQALLAFEVDPKSGELSPAAEQAAGDPPMAAAIDGTGRFAYLTRAGGRGSVHAIVGPAGMLSPVPGPGLAAVAALPRPDGAFVYSAGPSSLQLEVHAVDSETGVLTLASSLPLRWPASALAMDPAGRFLYAVHPAQSRISVARIDRVTGALEPVPGSPFDTSRGPVALAVDPAGSFLWALTRGGDVLSYRVDPASGALLAQGSVASAGVARALAVDPSGSFLYVANFKAGQLSAFRVDRESGTLVPLAGSPFAAGRGPAALAVHPSGRFLYEVDEISRQVSAYALDPATGALAALPGSPLATLATQPATAGEDYVASSGTVTFAPGTTTASVLVPVNGDLKFESDEVFSLVLSAPVNATLIRTQAAGIILDDERGRIANPGPGSTLPGPTANFTWTPGSVATHYWLEVGTTPGGTDIYTARQDGLSATVGGLPVSGVPVYVRLWTFVPAPVGYVFVDYTYTSFTAVLAQITTPTPGTTVPAGPVTFHWTAGSGISRYWLEIGTAPGGNNLYNQDQGLGLSTTVSGLPQDGRPIYVRLWSFVSGRTGWRLADFQYAGAGPVQPAAPEARPEQ